MLLTMICWDKDDGYDLRMATRPQHLEWLEANLPDCLFIGPIKDDSGEKFIGSLYVAEFESIEAAKAFAAEDPYAKAGLFKEVIIKPVGKAFPKD